MRESLDSTESLTTPELWAEALRHWPRVFGFAEQLTSDRTRAEDLCQEAYLRLAQMKRPVDASRSLLPLLLKIVQNLWISEGRRRPVESIDLQQDPDRTPHDHRSGTPLEQLTRAEDVSHVQQALAQLSHSWRAVLFLRDGLSLSYREIATVLDKSEDVVRVTLHRARRRVRDLLFGDAKESHPC